MTMQLSAVGLVANEMTKTLAFYRLLDLDIPAGADAEPHVEVTLAGGVRLMWDSKELMRSIDPTWTPPTGGGGAGLAFDCGTPSAVDKAYAEITAEGYHGHHEPWDAFWGQRYASVLDPDGNPVDLFAEQATAS